MIAVDVIIIGAGASGLMCAIEAGKRGRRVVVLDSANKAGKKILISGGGRCNFSNYSIEPANYISDNLHFCKSALSRYTQWDFLALLEKYSIAFEERSHGQLFCQNSAKDIRSMLLTECQKADVALHLNCHIQRVQKREGLGFQVNSGNESFCAQALVIASGGLSIPQMGASGFGYDIARQFDIPVVEPRAALVPFTLYPREKERFQALSGVSVPAVVSCNGVSFKENVLFTHRGLSGPAILQISSYWTPKQSLTVHIFPDLDLGHALAEKRAAGAAGGGGSKMQLKNVLGLWLPKRLITVFVTKQLLELPLQQLTDRQLQEIVALFAQWEIKPNGTEGFKKAEVTAGGVDCDALSSKTFAAREVPGLFFIGEVIDVTGWLGGYNFQWAWASGWCAGQYV